MHCGSAIASGPPMGWNTDLIDKADGCVQNETIILGTAQFMKKIKLTDYGYVYVNLGDCWQDSAR
jgi:hypothetical protein